MKMATITIGTLLWIVYGLTFLGIAVAPAAWLVALCIVMNALSFSMLFVIGHDAAHHALLRQPWQNDLLAQVCFLPALQPVSSWQVRHNVFHHGFAGWRTKDPGYPPATMEEYWSMSAIRRMFYRLKRSLVGFGFIYLADGWLKFGFSSAGMKRKQVSRLRCEVVVVTTFAFIQLTMAGIFSVRPLLLAWLLCVGAPFLIWNYVMSFVTYLHHTNPRIPWYDDYAEWRAKKCVLLTAHVKLPQILDLAYLNIMQHAAHHENARTAWYDLPAAQRSLARHNQVVELPFNARSILEVFRLCKLYDPKNHCWCDYTGAITSKCLSEATEPKEIAEMNAQSMNSDWPVKTG